MALSESLGPFIKKIPALPGRYSNPTNQTVPNTVRYCIFKNNIEVIRFVLHYA